ncbi:YfjP family GTPase [Streptomyces aureocirculatus]|uniref:YfjP family GTPase n=1 Tax=Streptomyces aureocirculatus TaxID=67275 RepID=UPI0004C7E724|nr:YfjP family GTPase [Streptomyces aureocirculatus]
MTAVTGHTDHTGHSDRTDHSDRTGHTDLTDQADRTDDSSRSDDSSCADRAGCEGHVEGRPGEAEAGDSAGPAAHAARAAAGTTGTAGPGEPDESRESGESGGSGDLAGVRAARAARAGQDGENGTRAGHGERAAEVVWDDGLIARRVTPGTAAADADGELRAAMRARAARALEPPAGPVAALPPATGPSSTYTADASSSCTAGSAPSYTAGAASSSLYEGTSSSYNAGSSSSYNAGTSSPYAAGSSSSYSSSSHSGAATSSAHTTVAYEGSLRGRLEALRELIGLSRARLDSATLAEAGQVLDEAAARRRLSDRHTVVALAGATGSGKSTLFNALAGVAISETGVRRPTTAAPIGCSWTDGAAPLLDRLGIPGRLRRRPLQGPDAQALQGLVLVDLPDHDSAADGHREHVDRILGLVDAVIWVVDPEKYADAMLHERYLRPMAGHAEVMFIVLNQMDRLPGDAADLVLDDLRRLLDEDGIALGEHGEPGATVLALSALTGDGVGELRESLGQFTRERGAAARRVEADLDAAAARLRPVYASGVGSASARGAIGLSEEARDEFADRLGEAVGAVAAGQAAERAWRRHANKACSAPWLRLWRWYEAKRFPYHTGKHVVPPPVDKEATARARVEHAVRTVADAAATGLPTPWGQAVREAAARGAQGLPEALDELALRAALPGGRPPRPGWWPVAVLAQAVMTMLQVVGGLWLMGQIVGVSEPNLGVPVLLMVLGIVGGPLVEWASRMAARGPARRYGYEAERRLREAAAGCGRARVLDPVAAELLRYREVREQYVRVAQRG